MTRALLIGVGIALSLWSLGGPAVSIDTISVVGVAIGADGRRVPGAEVKLVAQASGVGELAKDRTSSAGVFNLFVTNIGGPVGDLFVVYSGRDFDVQPLEVAVGQPGAHGWIDLRPGDLVFKALPPSPQLSTDAAADHLSATLKTQTVLLNAGLIDQKTFDTNVQLRGAQIRDKTTSASTSATLSAATEAKMKNFKLLDPGKIAAMAGRASAGGGS